MADIEAARRVVPVVSVQNLYNLSDRHWEPVLEHCQQSGIGFIPWFPLSSGRLSDRESGGKRSAVRQVADELGATTAQVALAWLLERSPVMLPIPGTSSLEHLEENCAAAGITLDQRHMELLGGPAV